jgi:hypothetical protein
MPNAGQDRNQGFLSRDLGYGSPVFYRPVPGSASRYYDPSRPENGTVSKHYVFKVYHPQLNPLQRAMVRETMTRHVSRQRQIRSSLAEGWMLRQAAIGNPVTPENTRDRQGEFTELYNRLRVEAHAARQQNRLENPDRVLAFQAGSPYSNLWVELGRRRGDENFPVGDSPRHAGAGGSYIDTVVKPYLQGLANGQVVETEQVEAGPTREQAAADRAAERAQRIAERRERRMRGDYG